MLVAPGRRNPASCHIIGERNREILVAREVACKAMQQTVSPSQFLPEPADELT